MTEKLVDMLESVLEECAICGNWKYPGECSLKEQILDTLKNHDREIPPGSVVEYRTADGPRFRLMVTEKDGYAIDLVTDHIGNTDVRLIFDHPDFKPENITTIYSPERGTIMPLNELGKLLLKDNETV